MDRITELETFISILDTGSLAGAARSLNRSPSGVTRILSDLEARMGVLLIERSSRRCRPTEVGKRFADQARHLLANYDDAIAAASDTARAPRGAIRFTAPVLFGRDHVAPAIAGFLDLHDEITVDLHLADRVIDLNEENFDLAVRIGTVTDPSLVARRIGTVRRLTVASPAYLEENGTPVTPQDLSAHRLIDHQGGSGATSWTFAGPRGRSAVAKLKPRFTVNHVEVALRFAEQGHGLTMAMSYQVMDALDAGRLVRVLRAFEPPVLPVALIYPESRRDVRRVRLLVEHIAASLARPRLSAD